MTEVVGLLHEDTIEGIEQTVMVVHKELEPEDEKGLNEWQKKLQSDLQARERTTKYNIAYIKLTVQEAEHRLAKAGSKMNNNPPSNSSFEKAHQLQQSLFHQPHLFLTHRAVLKPAIMDQAKKQAIASAIAIVENSHALMLSEMDKNPKNIMGIMHEHHQKLIRTLQ